MKILQRYVIGEVLRSFALALLTMTAIFVLFMVMAEALRMGLSPREIMNLVPYVIPGTLPYSVPVSLLFAVTVVFGRLASDNEIIAIKTAGLSAMTVLGPAFLLGGAISVTLLYSSGELIPRANTLAKLAIFKNSEDMFYRFLRRDRELNNPRWPFLIMARTVEGRTLIDPTFKHRVSEENPNSYDAVISARTAVINFDVAHNVARVYLDGAEVLQEEAKPSKEEGTQSNIVIINDNILELPLPEKQGMGPLQDKKLQERTTPEMVAEQKNYRKLLANERKRQSMAAALWMASGRIDRIPWGDFQKAFVDYQYWERKVNEYETEKQLRIALACGSLFFVLLGAPVGIRFAKRDFLSAFISCFMPIIIIYYPLMLLGQNMGKEGQLDPIKALWMGNLVLGILAGFVMPPVFKH